MFAKFADAYLMEHEGEGARIRDKTDLAAVRSQLSLAGLRPGMHCLDAGCASGAVTAEMAQIASPARVVGLDFSQPRLKEAEELARLTGTGNVEFRHGGIFDMPFEDGTFDFVWSRFVLEYLKDPTAAIREMKRVTKVGGLVVNADLDGNCLFHYPIDSELEKGLLKVTQLLSHAGFDSWVGRKLYHYYREVGFSDIKVAVMPYHVIAGEPTERERRNWHEKIETIRNKLTNVFPDRRQLDRLADGFRSLIDSPDTFTYSSLIIVIGTK